MLRVPVATYRLQFNSQFTFEHARRIAAYLADLGVSDVYASPILRARPGSQHGYDVTDAAALNPELGTEEEFTALHEELEARKLGFLLDIVPNHMAASQENSWWMSVLENGPQSRFLHYFDIDWRPVTTRSGTEKKVVLPFLGKPYGECVEAGEIQLHFDQDGFYFLYYDKRLPLTPQSYNLVLRECVEALPKEGVAIELRDLISAEEAITNSKFLKETLWRIYEGSPDFHAALDETITRINGVAGDVDSFNALDTLLDAQWYRLAYWRIASEKINYRRFFDVTDLVGVRVENPEVFEARYRRILDLIAERKVTGLRIDHIDGLYDPVSYMRKMQARLAEPDAEVHQEFYIVVEKILALGEELPADWNVAGTTGYDYLDSVNTVFVDPKGLERLTAFYTSFTNNTTSFEDLVYDRKKQVIAELFSGEMRALGKQLGELSMYDRNARDFAPVDLLAALTEITACMSVYRTYIREAEPSETDRTYIREAVAEARRRAASSVDERLFTFLERVLLIDPPRYITDERERWLEFVKRWQQFTGRVMAKGVEDTSFYNYNRLISLNEVGGEPGRHPGFDPADEFHRRNEMIARDWPLTMNATSTHDTKRSEDVRARISVLSELAETWEKEAKRWSKLTAPLREENVPAPNEELLVYQTLLGMWPLDAAELPTVEARLRAYLEKAAREAKTHTSWLAPNADYERRLLDFGGAVVNSDAFRQAFLRLQKKTAFHGYLNSLSQVVLKATSPGLPDFYQGTEVWDLSLVDPDNRRPVDYDARQQMLTKLKNAHAKGSLDVASLLKRWADGRIKLFVTWRALDTRARHAATFRDGAYTPLRSESPNVVAYTRGDDILVAVPRLTTQLVQPPQAPVGAVWGSASVAAEGRWRNVFTGEVVESRDGRIALAELFATFPVALCERVTGE